MNTISRCNDRAPTQLRPVKLTRGYTRYAAGSVLIEYGETKVLCQASILEKVPSFLKDKDQGWLTAEYGMLPCSTGERMQREAVKGNQSGRTMEIQRLIGRALRAVVDLGKLGERTLQIDCDVIQADGGTRTASITGAFVALCDAVQLLLTQGAIQSNPVLDYVAATSVGLVNGCPLLDLDYAEDSSCDTDMNVVMTGKGGLIEIQGTAEGQTFSRQQLNAMLDLAHQGIEELINLQRQVLAVGQ